MKAIILLALFFSAASFAQEKNLKAGKGNTFNPDISVNTLFLYQNSSRGNDSASDPKNGFSLDEAELQFTSDVDVYMKLNFLGSMHKESNAWKFEPEEAFAESLNIPFVILKAGKFKAALGKYNTYHKHAYPFLDQSMINTDLLGAEGVNNTGVSAAYLIPVSWFSELTAQVMTADTAPFAATSGNANLFVGRLKNLFDFSDALTMEWGISGATAPNDSNKTTGIYGTDLTFKWRPTEGGKYKALIWSTEFLSGFQQSDPTATVTNTDIKTQGVSSFIQWQVCERWWLQGRTEYDDKKLGSGYAIPKKKNSALIGFVPTEFSAFRLQYDNVIDPAQDKPEHKVSFQVNLSIGAHPAHSY